MQSDPSHLTRLRPSIATKGYVRERVEEREADTAARRQFAATTAPMLKLLAVEVLVLAVAMLTTGRAIEDPGGHTLVFAALVVSSSMELLVGWPMFALACAAVELVFRGLPSWRCDRVPGGSDRMFWPLGVALAVVPALALAWLAFPSSWALLLAPIEIANGVFLWWVVRRHGLWGVAWCRTFLVIGIAAAILALSWLV